TLPVKHSITARDFVPGGAAARADSRVRGNHGSVQHGATIMSTSRRQAMLVALVVIGLAAATPATAQDTGTITGTVVDQSGQVLPGVAVTLTNERTADSRTIVSDDRGEFAFRAVPPGLYTARAELS